MVDRRVLDGALGCPNCRDAFPVVAGRADLRRPPRRALDEPLSVQDGGDAELDRVQALLGIVRGPGTVVLVGAPASLAAALSDRIDDLHTVAADPGVIAWPDHPKVSRVTVADALPFFSWQLRGAVIDGRLGEAAVREAARVISKGSRVVVVHAPEGTEQVLRDARLEVLAAEAGTVVAARS